MPRVLLVTTNFWPEPTGIAIYTTDLVETLNCFGFKMSVLTSLPHYPWWYVPKEFSHITEGVSIQDAVSIFRASHLIPSKMNALMRIRFEASLWRNLRRVSKKFTGCDFDVVISCIPTLAAGMVGQKYAKRVGVPFGLIVQDLSGAGAKQSGLRGGALISKFALAIEGAVLKRADSVVVVSPVMRDVVLDMGVESSRVLQIENYSTRDIKQIDKVTARAHFGLESDIFLVLHTGNMGAKQNLENVVKAAKALDKNSKIRIYLVGHGNQEAKLKTLCRGLDNIFMMDAVPDNRYSALLSAADLLLINERATQMEMSLPSKLTSYLYAKRPVLAAVPRDGATWKFLEGKAELVEAENPELLANAITNLSRNPRRRIELATKGFEFANRQLSPEIGRKKYLDWVNRLIELKDV